MVDYSNMSDEEFLRPGKKEQFPPKENEYMEIQYGETPSGGDLSIAYFYDENHIPCLKSKARYMNIVEYTKDGVRVNEHYGKY